MKVLITGANGFIGSHLAEALIKKNAEVRCLVRKDSKGSYLNNLSVQKYVINYLDISSLMETDALENIDYLFHLAGITKGVTKKDFFVGNVLPTQNILEVLKIKNVQLKRFIYLSSQAAAGPAKSIEYPTEIDDLPAPVEYYGISKLEAEKIVHKYSAVLPVTIIRPCGVYGPRDVDFLNIFKQIHKGISLFYGNRNKYLSLIYVGDLIEGILKAAFSENSVGKTYFLCNDQPFSWQDINLTISKLEKKKIFVVNIPEFLINIVGIIGGAYSLITKKYSLINMQKIKLAKPKYWVCSNREAKKDFGFEANLPLGKGIKITYEWYKDNNWIR